MALRMSTVCASATAWRCSHRACSAFNPALVNAVVSTASVLSGAGESSLCGVCSASLVGVGSGMSLVGGVALRFSCVRVLFSRVVGPMWWSWMRSPAAARIADSGDSAVAASVVRVAGSAVGGGVGSTVGVSASRCAVSAVVSACDGSCVTSSSVMAWTSAAPRVRSLLRPPESGRPITVHTDNAVSIGGR